MGICISETTAYMVTGAISGAIISIVMYAVIYMFRD